jgi:hypothetical protein
VGAVLGIFIQRLAFAIGGFFAGAYLALTIATQMHAPGEANIWWIAGGVLGAIIAALVMDWAIIVLSSLAGATAILSPFAAKLGDQLFPVLFVLLAVIGVVFQGRKLIRPIPPPAAPAPPMRPARLPSGT